MAEIPESAYKISTPGRAATPGATLDLLQDSGPLVVASNHFLVAVFKQAFTSVDGGRLMQVNCHRLESWLFGGLIPTDRLLKSSCNWCVGPARYTALLKDIKDTDLSTRRPRTTRASS